jgi:hypothetical protein
MSRTMIVRRRVATEERFDVVVGGSVTGLVASDGLCDSAGLAGHGQMLETMSGMLRCVPT